MAYLAVASGLEILVSDAGVTYFEETIVTYVALVFFLSPLLYSSGDAGSQAATLMIHAIATGDVILKDWRYFNGRKLFVALALAATMVLPVVLLGFARGGLAIELVVVRMLRRTGASAL